MYNFIARAFNLIITSLIGLVLVRTVLGRIGSDYNGLNATVTQALSVFVILEGSFTLASLVALYKPYSENDMERVNTILSTTGKSFLRIGAWALASGVLFSVVYAHFIRTRLGYPTVLAVMFISLATACYNTMIVSKYRLVFQVTQTEYITFAIQAVSTVLSQAGAIAVVVLTQNIILLRLQYLFFSIVSGLVIIWIAKREFPFVDFGRKTDPTLIKGTTDVIISTTTGMIYNSAPVFFISTFSGTLYTSVYTVYYSVITMLHNFIYSFLDAPKNALGQVLAEGDEKGSFSVFKEYEFITIVLVSVLFSTTYILLTPFVRVYTMGVTDVDYIDPILALLLVVNSCLQFIHVPSGLCINLAGHFRVVRQIQVTACLTLLATMALGAVWKGLHGILLANTVTGIVLTVLEIRYARRTIFNVSPWSFVGYALPNLVFGAVMAYAGNKIVESRIHDWISFFSTAFVAFVAIVVSLGLFNLVFFPRESATIGRRLTRLATKSAA